MENFMRMLEEKLMPIANKISNQRHMAAIRKGIISTMPLIIVGSFFTILLNISFEPIASFVDTYRSALDIPFRYTVGILALHATYGISSTLGESYKLDGKTSGLLGTLAFLISTVIPTQVTEEVAEIGAGRYINIGDLGSGSLFSAIVTSIIAVEILRFMTEREWTIKMPEGVPPEVANSFIALLPTGVIIVFFVTVRHFIGFDLNQALTTLLTPLRGVLAGNSLIGGLLTVLLITGFWVMGIHGPAILGPVIRPFWDISIAENIEAFTSGASAHDLPNIFTEQFLQWYVWIGGAGATLALSFLFLLSKSEYLKKLGRLSVIPGLFNINEPMIFGAPIVMNPILAIPFILAPIVTTTLSYVLTVTNVVPMMMSRLPFTILAPIAAWISTDWSIMAGVLVVINFLISLAIYYPFFKIFERQQLEKEQNVE